MAIPDSVLDSPAAEMTTGSTDIFAKAKGILPTPYVVREDELMYA